MVHKFTTNINLLKEDFPAPEEGFLLTHFIAVADQERSKKFYVNVLGGKVVYEKDPAIVKVANSWLLINDGGGPTPDKPEVYLSPPEDLNQFNSFLNIRVADIQAKYKEWKEKGAEFITPPIDRGPETRCFMRDPDGYIIEVGEATRILDKV